MTAHPTNRYSPFIHLALWLLVLQLLFDISGLYYSFREFFVEADNFHFDEALLIIPFMIGIFYINTLLLVPRFFNRKGWWKYLLSLIGLFFLSFWSGARIYEWILNQGYLTDFDQTGFEDSLVAFSILSIGVSTSVGAAKQAFNSALQKSEALQKQKEAEMKYLAGQINPHFLFNSLNSLYALAITEDAPQTTEALLKLADMMRYPINEGMKSTVSLNQEIKFVQNYIELQQLRLGEDYPIHIHIDIPQQAPDIAPLLFIPFVENAFKYGVSLQQPQPIEVQVSYQENQLSFRCKNAKVTATAQDSTQLGIRNAKERLQLLYPTTHQLLIQDEETRYTVRLHIKF